MGINVFLHEGMQRFFEENPRAFVQMAAKRRYSINNTLAEEEKEHLRTLLKAINKTGTTLLDDGKGNFYLLDHADKEDIEKRKSNQDGFNCRLKFSAKDYTGEELNTIKEKIKYGNIRDQRSFNKWAKTYANKQRRDISNSIVAEVRGTNGNNDNLYSRPSEGTSLRGRSNTSSSEDFGTGFIRVYNNDGTNGPRYIPVNGNNELSFFLTPRGEVYGFIDKKNDMYLDERKISPEHPIHEYTHIWDRVIASRNPKLWQRGVELMKQTSLWNEILNDENYGKRWQAINGLPQTQLESLIASEVHSRLSGKKGMALIEEMAKKEGQKGIIAKLKQWLLDMYKELKKTFSPWTKEDLDKLTLEDFTNMTVRDFMEGINPLTAKENTINDNNNGKEQYRQTDEFRRVQEASRKLSEGKVSSFQRGERKLNDEDKQRIGGLLGRLLGSNSNGSWHGVQSNLTHTNKDGNVGTFPIGKVGGSLFHDIFETVRTYLPNGELVDLHEDYSECKCYVTSDGLCGFAIEPDGNLVSVFSLSPSTNKGFLYAIRDFVRQEGATHLDAYASSNQPLQKIYAKTIGFHTASTMDYNMEYDHDDIAKNHGNPQVVFMVDHEVAEPKHFDKDSYDAAQQYQLDQLKDTTTGTDTRPSAPVLEEAKKQQLSLPNYQDHNNMNEDVTVDADWKVQYLEELDTQMIYLYIIHFCRGIGQIRIAFC